MLVGAAVVVIVWQTETYAGMEWQRLLGEAGDSLDSVGTG
jgi:hypothetical protein